MDAQQQVSRRQWVTAGAVGGVVGALLMTGLMFVGRVTLGTPLIPELMAERLFALIPLDLFSLGIRLFGLKAKYLAFWGMVGLFVLLGGLLGVLFTWLTTHQWLTAHWRGGLAYGSLLWALFGLVGSPLLGVGLFGAALKSGPLPASGSLVILYWAYGATLGALADRLLRHPHDTLTTTGSSCPPLNASRRAFAERLLAGVLTVASVSALAQFLDTLSTRGRAFAQDLFQRIKGLPPELTPNEQFYTISKNVFDPKVKVSRWSLQVKGLVERPMTLTYNELKALPMKEQFGTLECISNEVGGNLISNARWTGVPLSTLLTKAGVKSSAKKVVFRSADGYSTAIPLTKAMHPDTLLAVEMNGVPLPDDHGFPIRLINPGHYGMKNPKWITEIELTEQDYKGYWESRGWSDEARVKTMSRIDVPTQGSKVAGRQAETGGIAFAGDRGIRQVEVSVDGGLTWRKAMLKPALDSYTWVLWGLVWELPTPANAGVRHGASLTLKVRAIDGSGNIQTAQVTRVLPDGASGYHTIHVTLS